MLDTFFENFSDFFEADFPKILSEFWKFSCIRKNAGT